MEQEPEYRPSRRHRHRPRQKALFHAVQPLETGTRDQMRAHLLSGTQIRTGLLVQQIRLVPGRQREKDAYEVLENKMQEHV